MKKFAEFLTLPGVNLAVGLILLLWIGCCIWSAGDDFSPTCFFYGALTSISLDIFSYGYNTLVDNKRSKKKQDDLCGDS